ncbi:MAG: hypothetical protein U5K43_12055 [Halofilum sp. (in: g-proteobacteria)]|nr:hypothetical protein [Halofilum sp. (in: g-proteobacteria)]
MNEPARVPRGAAPGVSRARGDAVTADLSAGAAWIDDTIVPIAEARLPLLDWGFLHSDAT